MTAETLTEIQLKRAYEQGYRAALDARADGPGGQLLKLGGEEKWLRLRLNESLVDLSKAQREADELRAKYRSAVFVLILFAVAVAWMLSGGINV